MTKKSSKAKKDKKPWPQPKPNRQIPNSLIRPIKFIGINHFLLEARAYPIMGCWIMEGWRDIGLTPVVVAREQEPGRVMFGVYLVDLYCLGVKDAFTKADFSLARFESELPMLCSGKPEECSVELAHEVIYGALEFAAELGFQPYPDFKALLADIMLDPPDAHPRVDKVVFGKDGKPFFVSGPYDDQYKIASVLEKQNRTAGDGKFNYLAGFGGIPELSDDDL